MELRDYLSVIGRRKRVVIVVPLIVVATALALSLSQKSVYRATARLMVGRDQSVFSKQDTGAPDPNLVDTEMQVMQSQGVRDIVRSRLGSAPKVSTVQVGATSIVEVSAESTDARRAAAVTQAYIDAYVTFKRQQASTALGTASKEIQAQIDTLQTRIDALADQLGTLPACTATNASPACGQRQAVQQDRDALLTQQVPFKQQLAELQIDTTVANSGAHVITPAAVPQHPVRPTPVRDTAMGLALGLLVGLGLAFLFEHLDDTIKDEVDLKRPAAGLAVLGMIPPIEGWRDKGQTRLVASTEPMSEAAEAYRTLRTAIRFVAVERPLRIIQVTSATVSEGKTTTIANLAYVLSRAGERVAVVSCDLRRPRLHKFFDLPNELGFTSVLVGEVPLSSALQQVGNDGRLVVLTSGPLPPNPSELLSSTRASQLFAELQARADTVLVDSPAVLPVTDAAVLSSRVDGTLLVVRAGVSTVRQVSRAIELLRRVGAPLVGTVINSSPTDAMGGYRYYHGHERRSAKPPKVDSDLAGLDLAAGVAELPTGRGSGR
jgi:capsular exopolysaccharide synthesis family protein